MPKPADLVGRAEEVGPASGSSPPPPWESIDALKGAAKEISAALGRGVVALALDADEPQLFVTVSDDLVARGIAAGDLVRAAMAASRARAAAAPRWPRGRGPGVTASPTRSRRSRRLSARRPVTRADDDREARRVVGSRRRGATIVGAVTLLALFFAPGGAAAS